MDIPQGAGNVGMIPAEGTVGAVIETNDGNAETLAMSYDRDPRQGRQDVREPKHQTSDRQRGRG